MPYIDRDAFIKQQRELYCKNCTRRMGVKNGKLKEIYKIGEVVCKSCELNDALDDLDDYPEADVAPVVHARWEKIQRTKRYVDGIGVDVETGKPFINKKEYKYDEYKCPVCKKFAKGDYLRFCDYCGAKFDEMFGKDEEVKEDDRV